jgi:hypothetical protein
MMLRRALLSCGIVSSVLYVATDVLAARRFPGYRYTDYSISEEIAVEAPTRRLWVWLGIPDSVLVTALGMGVWASAGRKRRAGRITGVALVGYSAASMAGLFLAPLLAPRGVPAPEPEGTRRARRHMLATAVINLLLLLAMGFGATVRGKWFRAYTYATMTTLLVFGSLAGVYVPRLASDRPTPGLGVVERVNVYATMLWLATLPITLWGDQRPSASRGTDKPSVILERIQRALQRGLQ